MSGDGHFERYVVCGSKWRIQHADCVIRWRGKTPAPVINVAWTAHEDHVKRNKL